MGSNDSLLLPDLTIKSFRGIDELNIPRLGRVTLLAGKNGIGKTTVLDAIRIYTARGHPFELRSLLRRRGEELIVTDEEGDNISTPDWTALFHGRPPLSEESKLSIQSEAINEQLYIQPVFLAGEELRGQISLALTGMFIQGIQVTFNDFEHRFPILPVEEWMPKRLRSGDILSPIKSQILGPHAIGSFQLAKLWDNIALLSDEDSVIRALNMTVDGKVDRITMVSEEVVSNLGRSDQQIRRRLNRRALVRFEENPNLRIPLKSLGEGASRILGVALALANGKNGFLLIDEVENGIHYSIQRDFWRMLMQTAFENNVQVIATTHSLDSIKGFAQAAKENEKVESKLVRLSQRHGPLCAVEYSEDDLIIAAEHGIEVR